MKKHMRILAALLALMLMVGMISGCGEKEPEQSNEPSPSQSAAQPSESTPAEPAAPDYSDISLAVTVPALGSSFCAREANGFVAGVESMGATATINDPNVDPAAQMSALENFKISGCDGYLVHPVQAEALISTMEEAAASGMILAAYDETIPEELIAFRVRDDLNAVGRQYAQPGIDWVKEKFGGKTQIAIIAVKDSEDSKNGKKLTGIKEAVAENLPESEVVMVEYCNTEDEHYNAIENIITAYPNVGLIITQLEETTAAEALASMGYTASNTDMCLVGCDYKEESYELITGDSVLRASCGVDIYTTGYQAGIMLVKACAGEEVEKELWVTYTTVTVDTIDEIHESLYGG